MVRPTLAINATKMGVKDTIFQNMKHKLLNESKQRSSNNNSRQNSVFKEATYKKDTITGIYQHPDMINSASGTKDKDSGNFKNQLNDLFSKLKESNAVSNGTKKPQKSKITFQEPPKPNFATTNLANTNLKARSEFDNIIKDWITTDWLDLNPVVQKKPCHIFIHDKLLCKNYSLLDVVDDAIRNINSSINIPRDVLQKAWNVETRKVYESSNSQNLNLREIIKNIYWNNCKLDVPTEMRVQKFLKDKNLEKSLLKSFKKSIIFDEQIFNKVKNFEGLNTRNDITIIMDNEINLLLRFQYNDMLLKLNSKQENPLNKINVLRSKTLLGSKVNDVENLQELEKMLNCTDLHRNERFVMITSERATSLEYYRQLKLYKKLYPASNFNGCVIYFNRDEMKKTDEVINTSKYTGKEMYYVTDDFTQIYDIINIL